MKFDVTYEDKYKIGVYCITNIVSGKKYIGSTGNSFYNRYHQHLSDYKLGKHNGRVLKRAFDKYGIGNFSFSILEICKEEDRLEREQHYIDSGTDYNSCKRAGTLKGYKHPSSSKTRTIRRGQHHCARQIDQYTLDGNFIISHDSIKSAAESVGQKSPTHIMLCCKGKLYSSAGYKWSYKGKELPSRPMIKRGMPIIISKDGLAFMFTSQQAASNYISSFGFKCNQGRINRALNTDERVYGFTIKKN